MALLKLIRFPNLVIVALTQYLLYLQVILPAFRQAGIEAALDLSHFSLLVLDTVLITAGGYVINDLIDLPMDLINRRDQVIIKKHFSEQSAYWLYFLFSLTGFGLALYLAFYVDNLKLLWIYPAAVVGLYAYSAYLKKRLLVGNLLVAAYCAGVAGIVWFAEREGLNELQQSAPGLAADMRRLFGWYLFFAFVSTMFREVVKDMEDAEGDRRANCRTVPIIWGLKGARWVALAFALLLLAGLTGLCYQYFFTMSAWSIIFLLLAIGLPVVLALIWLQRARRRRDYSRLSRLGKVIMLSGVLLLLFLTIKLS